MARLTEGTIWLNKRLNLAVIMALTGGIMAFQKAGMLRAQLGAALRIEPGDLGEVGQPGSSLSRSYSSVGSKL